MNQADKTAQWDTWVTQVTEAFNAHTNINWIVGDIAALVIESAYYGDNALDEFRKQTNSPWSNRTLQDRAMVSAFYRERHTPDSLLRFSHYRLAMRWANKAYELDIAVKPLQYALGLLSAWGMDTITCLHAERLYAEWKQKNGLDSAHGRVKHTGITGYDAKLIVAELSDVKQYNIVIEEVN